MIMKKGILIIFASCTANVLIAQLHISPGTTLSLSGDVKVTLQNMSLINDGAISAPDKLNDGEILKNKNNEKANFTTPFGAHCIHHFFTKRRHRHYHS